MHFQIDTISYFISYLHYVKLSLKNKHIEYRNNTLFIITVKKNSRPKYKLMLIYILNWSSTSIEIMLRAETKHKIK